MHPKKIRWGFPGNKHVSKIIDWKQYGKIQINVHGGITFAHNVKAKEGCKYPQQLSKGNWIGWDYNHAGDQMWELDVLKEQSPELYTIEIRLKNQLGSLQYEAMHKKWKAEEVLCDIYDAIDQMLKIK